MSAGQYSDVIVQFMQGVIQPGGFEIDLASCWIRWVSTDLKWG